MKHQREVFNAVGKIQVDDTGGATDELVVVFNKTIKAGDTLVSTAVIPREIFGEVARGREVKVEFMRPPEAGTKAIVTNLKFNRS